MTFPFEPSDAGATDYVRQVLEALGLSFRTSRLRQLTVTRDGSGTHFSRFRPAIVAPDNAEWSSHFTEYLGPRLSRGREAELLTALSDSDTPWPICEAILQQIGGLSGKPLKRASALLTAILPRVYHEGLNGGVLAFLDAKPSRNVLGTVGQAFSCIVEEDPFLDLATFLLAQPGKRRETSAVSLLSIALSAGMPMPNTWLAALTVTLLKRVRERGSASQRHLLLQGLRRYSDGDDWPTWMLEMHASPPTFSMGSMQTGFLGFT